MMNVPIASITQKLRAFFLQEIFPFVLHENKIGAFFVERFENAHVPVRHRNVDQFTLLCRCQLKRSAPVIARETYGVSINQKALMFLT